VKYFRFINYCWAFYGPQAIYGDFFGHNLTMEELLQAIEKRTQIKTPEFHGNELDSFDRELVRDLMLAARGLPTEYPVTQLLKDPQP
jgi:hypothetical protein